MITADTNFTIEDGARINANNILSDVFKTTTKNNVAKATTVSPSMKKSYSSIRANDIPGIGALGIPDGKTYQIGLKDMLKALAVIAKKLPGGLYDRLVSLLKAMDPRNFKLLNKLLALAKAIDRGLEAICSALSKAFDWLGGLPVIKFIDSLVGLILLSGSLCKKFLYAVIIDAIAGDDLKRLVNAVVVKASLNTGDLTNVTEVINHPSAAGMAQYYPWIPHDITTSISIAPTPRPDTEQAEHIPWVKPAGWDTRGMTPEKRKKSSLHKYDYTAWVPSAQWLLISNGLLNVDPQFLYTKAGMTHISSDRFSTDFKKLAKTFAMDYQEEADKTKVPSLPDSIKLKIKAIYATNPPYLQGEFAF